MYKRKMLIIYLQDAEANDGPLETICKGCIFSKNRNDCYEVKLLQFAGDCRYAFDWMAY
jgi:hypothetical protein